MEIDTTVAGKELQAVLKAVDGSYREGFADGLRATLGIIDSLSSKAMFKKANLVTAVNMAIGAIDAETD